MRWGLWRRLEGKGRKDGGGVLRRGGRGAWVVEAGLVGRGQWSGKENGV